MTTEAKIQLTSSELGTLWMIYESNAAFLTISEFHKNRTIEKEAQNILKSYIDDLRNIKNEIIKIFNNEGAAIPVAYNEKDIINEAPPLFDDLFNIMFLRQITKLNTGYSALFSVMSYMKEVNDVFHQNYEISNKYYMLATSYLLRKGVLARPPYLTMPKQAKFIEDKNYMSGYNLFSDKRSLNTIEIGYINEIIEDNIFGMQLITGFAQVAKEKEVKEFFLEGKELAKKTISDLGNVLEESDIQPPSTWAGKATDSTQAPYSDNLMMFIISLITNTSITINAIGTSFSMRSDLPAKLIIISKDMFNYSKKGGKIMVSHKWMEEPPSIEDRNQLITSSK